MRWRQKSLAFWLLEYAPGGEALYYYLQRYVTKTLPRDITDYPRYMAGTFQRRDQLLHRQPAGKILMEFGAGWDLFHNIVLYCYGFEHQIVVDVTSWMRPNLVNSVIAELRRNPPPDAARIPPSLLSEDPAKAKKELRNIYGIEYRTPADARHMDMPDNSLDYIATTTTLEHIPFDVLRQILVEGHRILKPDGIICMMIDYSDHFSHADSAITAYNFLQFSEAEWQCYNPPKHYQNRRRHSDFRKLFLDGGYSILHEDEQRPQDWEQQLERVRLHPDFAGYAREDIGITSGTYVLSHNKGAAA